MAHPPPVPQYTRRQVLPAGVALAAALGAPALRAATSATPATATTARTATTLTVAAFPAVDKIVEAALPAWRALHPDVAVKVVSRQFIDHHTAMTAALSTNTHLPDLMALEVGYVGRFARGAGLDDLNSTPYRFDQIADRFARYAVQQARRRDGGVVAVPSDIGPGTLLYRTDLLAQAGLAEADLTTSWAGYVKAGLRLKAATGAYLVAHARDVKDILIRTGLQPGQGLYFDQASRVLVNTPRFQRAFELAREVRQHKLDARVSAWSNDWSESFKRGRLATQMTGAWLAGHLANWLAPDTRGKWRAAHLPEGAWAAYGGAFLSIPRGATAAHKPWAWELIRFLTLSPERQLAAFKSQDAFPALLSTYDDAFFDQPLPFLGGQPARRLWREAVRNISAVEVHKQDAFAGEVIDSALDQVLDAGKPVAQALADAERLLARRAHR